MAVNAAPQMVTFVHQRTAALLERPDGWGPPEAVELQLLLLLEMGHVAVGAPPEVVGGTMARYRRYLGCLVGGPPLSLAGRLGLTTHSNERFVGLLRGFVAEERNQRGLLSLAELPMLPSRDQVGPVHYAAAEA